MGGPGSGRRKAIKRDTAVPPTDEPIEAAGTDLLKPLPRVTQPTGGTIEVQDDLEKTFYDGQHAKYLEENKFTSSDLTDLDSLLLQELLDYNGLVNLRRSRTMTAASSLSVQRSNFGGTRTMPPGSSQA